MLHGILDIARDLTLELRLSFAMSNTEYLTVFKQHGRRFQYISGPLY